MRRRWAPQTRTALLVGRDHLLPHRRVALKLPKHVAVCKLFQLREACRRREIVQWGICVPHLCARARSREGLYKSRWLSAAPARILLRRSIAGTRLPRRPERGIAAAVG